MLIEIFIDTSNMGDLIFLLTLAGKLIFLLINGSIPTPSRVIVNVININVTSAGEVKHNEVPETP